MFRMWVWKPGVWEGLVCHERSLTHHPQFSTGHPAFCSGLCVLCISCIGGFPFFFYLEGYTYLFLWNINHLEGLVLHCLEVWVHVLWFTHSCCLLPQWRQRTWKWKISFSGRLRDGGTVGPDPGQGRWSESWQTSCGMAIQSTYWVIACTLEWFACGRREKSRNTLI